MRIKLKDLFGFADQEKKFSGLGYSLTLKRNNNNDAVIRTAGVDAAKIDIKILLGIFDTIYAEWKTNNSSLIKY